MAIKHDQFLLFGDSITQQSGNQDRGFGFAPALQDAYIRRLDVVNRGLSGYNTDQALKVLTSIIPTPEQARVRFLMVFFGANDASLAESRNGQHVPLATYKENLAKIVTHDSVKAHNARIILVAPPPVNEHLMLPGDIARGFEKCSRTAVTTRSYAQAVCELGKELGIPVLDLWTAFMSTTGWKIEDPDIPGGLHLPENSVLTDFLHDGLHFNPLGYRILFDELMELISVHWPDQVPARLPFLLPMWNDPAAWDAFEKSSVGV
ncbi:SGNH hydrolase [Lophium mytilinum]|uniref:SGNH hydrolase n=1 Tax=Lophium mytilinum TaxID=390894 RepID=A0A6A6QZV8_9PEZI|nr:SGNH hydrolase [Lophium mytilinum]